MQMQFEQTTQNWELVSLSIHLIDFSARLIERLWQSQDLSRRFLVRVSTNPVCFETVSTLNCGHLRPEKQTALLILRPYLWRANLIPVWLSRKFQILDHVRNCRGVFEILACFDVQRANFSIGIF